MRVPGSITNRRYMNNYNNSLARLNRLSEKVSSWRKFDSVSEDPTAAVNAFLVRDQIAKNEMYETNLKSAKDLLSSAETSATKVAGSIKLASTNLLKAINGTNATNKEVMAQQLENYRDEIIKTMNNSFSGRYIFSGTRNEAPFTLDADGMLLFNGQSVATTASAANFPSNKAVYVDIGLGMKFNVAGEVDPQTALKISTSGVDFLGFGVDAAGLDNNICNELTTAARLLRQNNIDTDECRKYVKKLDEQHTKVLTGIADLGNRINFIDYNIERLDSDTLNLQQTQNNLEVINPAEAITDMKTEELAYKTCLQIGPRLIQSSLFDYLK